MAVSRHFKAAHSAAIIIHNKLSDYIDYSETKHELRVSSIILRAHAGHVGNLLRMQLFPVHMMCELDQTAAGVRDMMKGNRFMNVIGADMNGELIKIRSANVGIGAALKQRNKEGKDGEHSEMLKMAVTEWNMRVTNTYEEWWHHIEERERIEDDADQ